MTLSSRLRLSGLLALLLVSASVAHAQQRPAPPQPFALKDGDTVVFYGDSITDQRLYTIFTETYIVTRFPRLKINFVHSGWGGDTVGGGGGGPIDVRLQRDVLAYKPTVMTIMLGMNDGGYHAFDQPTFDAYAKGYQHILDVVTQAAPGIRITAIEPSPFDDVTQPPKFEGGYNAVLVRYGQFLRDTAQREHLTDADFNAPVVAALQKANATDAATAKGIIPDRVHPSPAGHLIMAEALLKAWHAPPTVTAVRIDAAGKRVVLARNAQVSDLKSAGSLTWTQTDGALPMPLDLNDPTVALALRSSDFVDALDQEPLTVTGLSAAKYELKIDGGSLGTFTKEQLAAGINLATLPTPMFKQAQTVYGLTGLHSTIHTQRWRSVQLPFQDDKSPDVRTAAQLLMTTLDAEEADTVAQQRAGAQPVPHGYELVPQPQTARVKAGLPKA